MADNGHHFLVYPLFDQGVHCHVVEQHRDRGGRAVVPGDEERCDLVLDVVLGELLARLRVSHRKHAGRHVLDAPASGGKRASPSWRAAAEGAAASSLLAAPEDAPLLGGNDGLNLLGDLGVDPLQVGDVPLCQASNHLGWLERPTEAAETLA